LDYPKEIINKNIAGVDRYDGLLGYFSRDIK